MGAWENTTFDVAINGLVALECLKKNSYHLVLMDLQMPVMDGYEATQAIRAGACGLQNSDLPIIAVTADVTEKAKNKVFEVGMDDYLTKPIQKEELYHKIKKAIYLQKIETPLVKG